MSSNSKSNAAGELNTCAPLLLVHNGEHFDNQYPSQLLDNTKAQKETLETFKEVGRTNKKPFLLGFPARHKQSLRGSAGKHNRNFTQQLRSPTNKMEDSLNKWQLSSTTF